MDAQKIEALKKRREQLDARIKKMEAADKTKKKKEETRRKILLGAYTLDQAKKNGNEGELQKAMLNYLTRDIDKKLFERMLEDEEA